MHKEMTHKSSTQQNRYSCFRCANGCIHVVADNIMITLSQEQFVGFAQAIENFLQTIASESDTFLEPVYRKSVVM
jgi:hypothetical protein